MNKPPLVTSEKSIFNLMQVINDTIQYAETVEQTLLAAMRDVVAGEGVEIAPVPDASTSVKGVVTLADSTTDPELYAVSVALLNAVVGQIGQTTGTLSSLGTTNKANLVNAINEVKNATADTAGYVGNLQGLNTTAKANLVAAINEVKSLAGTDYSTVIGVLNTLTTTAKSNLVSAINEVQSNQGALNGLNTTAKNNLTSAINEVKTKADGVGTLTSLTTTAKSNLVVAINEILALAGDLATLSTTAKSNLVGAINELKTSIGTLSSLTTTSKTSIVSAINELKTSIGNLASLTTTEKTSTVLAINEVKTLADSAHTKIGTLASLTTTEKNSLVGALNEVKQYANDGKTAIATAVTAKGVTASPADTFSSLATKIGQIPTGGGGGGTGGGDALESVPLQVHTLYPTQANIPYLVAMDKNDQLMSGYYGNLFAYDLPTTVNRIAISPNGKYLVYLTDEGGEASAYIAIKPEGEYQFRSPSNLTEVGSSGTWIESCTFSPDGMYLFISKHMYYLEGDNYAYKGEIGGALSSIATNRVGKMKVSPDSTVVSYALNSGVFMARLAGGVATPVGTLEVPSGSPSNAMDMDYSGDGAYLAVAYNSNSSLSRVVIYDTNNPGGLYQYAPMDIDGWEFRDCRAIAFKPGTNTLIISESADEYDPYFQGFYTMHITNGNSNPDFTTVATPSLGKGKFYEGIVFSPDSQMMALTVKDEMIGAKSLLMLKQYNSRDGLVYHPIAGVPNESSLCGTMMFFGEYFLIADETWRTTGKMVIVYTLENPDGIQVRATMARPTLSNIKETGVVGLGYFSTESNGDTMVDINMLLL